jgi:hypothetical protein
MYLLQLAEYAMLFLNLLTVMMMMVARFKLYWDVYHGHQGPKSPGYVFGDITLEGDGNKNCYLLNFFSSYDFLLSLYF